MAKPLVLKKGITVQAKAGEVDPSSIGYDPETDYPPDSLPANMLRLVVTSLEPDVTTVKNNDLIVIVDE